MKLLLASILGVAVLMLSLGAGVAAQPGDGDSSVIIRQNLFHPSRSIPPPPPKPVPAKPVAQPAPPPPPPPKFELDGIVEVEGEKGMALLQEPQLTQGKSRVVTLGESIGPYTLVQIEPDRVRLESETRTVTVLLNDPTKTPKTGAAASLPALQLATPQTPAPPAGDLRQRLRAPALLQAPPAQQAEVSAESPAVNPNPEPGENKVENVLGIFRKAFEPLKGQIPLFLGESSESQGQQGQGQRGQGR